MSYAFRYMMFKARILSHLNIVRSIVRLNHPPKSSLRREVMGLSFNGPLGLGPGLDKKGELYNVFTDYGFSYVEIGPIGADTVKDTIINVQKHPVDKDTFISVCIDRDHERAFSLAYDFMDMFVLEIKSHDPIETIEKVLDIRLSYDVYKPVLLRITKDCPSSEINEILNFCLLNGVDGFVVEGLGNVRRVAEFTLGRVPIIGYGSIRSTADVQEMLKNGACMIEITTGFVMRGPALVKNILKQLDADARNDSVEA